MKAGQTLTILLVITGLAMAIVGAAVAVVATNSEAGSKAVTGEQALALAESGAEEGMLQLLRNPNYSGETLTTTDGTATITVTGIDPKTIISTAVVATYKRKIQVVAGYTNYLLTVQTWKEIN